jgi:hypothetical protein
MYSVLGLLYGLIITVNPYYGFIVAVINAIKLRVLNLQ